MSIELTPGPDIHPLYPTPVLLQELLASELDIPQRQTLIAHSLLRAVSFGDIALVTYIIRDDQARPHVDLSIVDEDGLGLISQAILGFGEESEKDVEREEVVRMLISEGADPTASDAAGWTPLHYAALHAPLSLIAYLLTHGASPLAKSHKGLTPLDVITAYEDLPGRGDVSLILEEAMREAGWLGSAREQARERRKHRKEALREKLRRQTTEWEAIGRILEIGDNWWGGGVEPGYESFESDNADSESGDENSEDEEVPTPYTPQRRYDTMVVFSLSTLPTILHSLIFSTRPVLRPLSQRAAPANALYLLARFACIWCDPSWVEELIVGAVDRIEEVAHSRAEDLSQLCFWLYNSTLLLHLLRCDNEINETCEYLEMFDLLEELINAIYVLIIRVAEKRIDVLIDPALLDHSPLSSEFESIQFESEWSIFRSLTTPRKKTTATPSPARTPNTLPPSVTLGSRPESPAAKESPTAKALATLRSKFQSSPTPGNPLGWREGQMASGSPASPASLTSILTALHTLLSLYGINPVIIIQAFSQTLYWTACELFNRLLTRKRYICRSRAMQIGINLGIIEEWAGQMGLPKGVTSHFGCVRELLGWLQCLSSIGDFATLIATIQTMKSLNPLQMRRAVRDYRYEVNEGRMTEECSQYLAQLQKDWERRRVKLGVELARKERERERDEDLFSSNSDEPHDRDSISHKDQDKLREREEAQRGIDSLFDRDKPKNEWAPPKPPEPFGELLDSRYMLPLIFPSDPFLLCACPGLESMHPPVGITAGMDSLTAGKPNPGSIPMKKRDVGHSRSSSRASHTSHGSISSVSSVNRGPMRWRKRGRRVRQYGAEILDWVDAHGRMEGSHDIVWGLGGMKSVGVEDYHSDGNEGDKEDSDREEVAPVKISLQIDEPPAVVDTSSGDTLVDPILETRSVSSGSSTRSYLTPNLPSAAEKRRSMRLARRSSGGDTIMPYYQAEEDEEAFDNTPTKRRSDMSIA